VTEGVSNKRVMDDFLEKCAQIGNFCFQGGWSKSNKKLESNKFGLLLKFGTPRILIIHQYDQE